jgi:hypothetical protein
MIYYVIPKSSKSITLLHECHSGASPGTHVVSIVVSSKASMYLFFNYWVVAVFEESSRMLIIV